MPRAASVWLDVLPSMAEFRRELRRELEDPVRQSATRAGEQGGEGLMAGLGGKMKAGALGLGVAVGALMVQGLEQSMAKQKATGQLKASLGLTAKDAQKAGQAAGALYSNAVTESVEEGAAAVKAIMSAGIAPPKATTQQLASIATKVQDVSTLFETDLGQTANAVGQIMKTGLAKNSKEALDTITRGFQVMGPRADDLMDTFNEYSTIFRSLNLPVKTVTGLLSQGMKAGARDTDVVADALKEFQIRATDGSKASAAGFDALGLSAKGMTAQIAKGGKGASDGLQTVLDRLRGMKNPVDRNAAAVALFGTKAEDMGKALYALDPSKAVKDLGKVGGAAKQAGDDLRNNAGAKIEQFKRRALMAIGDTVAKYVIPGLTKFGSFLNSDVLPVVKSFAGVMARTLGPALRGVGAAFSATVGWLKEYGVWLVPLGIAVAGVAVAMNTQAIATGAVSAVFGIYRAVILTSTAVTQGFAGAQAFLSAVMRANPIVLVITAIIALGAALVIAYKKSETFRAIVQGAWEGIKTAALWVWNNALKPAFAGLVAAFKAIGAAASWLWSTVLQPVFSFIGTAAKILATVIGVIVVGPFILGFKLIAAAATWLWGAVLKPVFGWIGGIFRSLGAVAVWLWTNAISPVIGWIVAGFRLFWAGVKVVFGWVKAGLRAVGAAATWLWTNAISPVIDWIVAGFQFWWSGIKVVFGYAKAGIRAVGDVFKWLWNNGVKPVLGWIGDKAGWLWRVALKPAFDAMKKGVKAVGRSFEDAKDFIGRAWSKVQDLAKIPVKFLVNTIYNKAIVPTWNTVAGAFGAPEIKRMVLPKGFATGGAIRGAGTATSDSIPAWLSNGEHVWTAKEVRNAGGHGAVMAMRRAAANGRMGMPGFKDGGGIFGWVKSAGTALKGVGSAAWDAVKKGASWLGDTIEASARAGVKHVVNPLLAKLPGADTGFGKMVRNIPDKILDAIFGYAKSADSKVEDAYSSAAVGGSGVKRWSKVVLQALKMVGQPASLLNTVLRRMNQESGGNPRAINNWDSNAKAGMASRGLMQTIPGTFAAYAGKLKGRGIYDPLANVYASMRYALSRYGSLSKAYNRAGGYATGGRPKAGELAWVGEAGPELVRFKGGETVYNNRDSMSMAAGLGVRGFAKGTASAKARKEIPGDLTNFTKSLKGSAADIAKAAKALTDDLKAAGGAGKSLAASTAKVSARLQTMAKQRDAAAAKVSAAKAGAADQKKSAADYLGLSNLSDATSIGDVLAGLKNRQSTLKGFQGQIAGLSKKGLSQDLISQLVALGPDSALGQMVSRANAGQIKQLNALAKSGAKLSTSYGNTMADAMYDAGKSASKGFLTGLLADEKAIQAAMAKVGAGAVKAIRSKKGIDAHSPSRKAAQAGKDLGAGLVAGMAASGPSVATAAERLGATSIPSAGGVVPVTSGGASTGTALADRPVFLVVEDGTVLRAYVDDRVDAGLTDVRRTSRAGSKRN
ncbi:phage tail tape measure protein [Streptomyces angustmyceticus]|uniref:phage tail tape measure protein n=1 Tax=Streptomyces angustmyceticus TaxID=285578 RepID=UPI00344C647A